MKVSENEIFYKFFLIVFFGGGGWGHGLIENKYIASEVLL